ncbi:MAG: ABC transporter substrate-binding protein [Nitrospira sp.]|nr:ABC transporter substrate-binding protein [Nitrospira sp.]
MIPMDYRLLIKEGRWHAYDIIVDGVSLIDPSSNLRVLHCPSSATNV